MFFLILLILLIVVSTLGIWYLSHRIRKYQFINDLGLKGKVLSFVIPFVLIAALYLVGMNMFSLIIIVLHLLIAMLICDCVGRSVKKLLKRRRIHYIEDISAVILTVVYLGAGWFFAHHVFETSYSLDTAKDIGEPIRVVQITDSHLGITLDGAEFAEQVERIGETDPDVVVITGDFVDDDSTKNDMLAACEALGDLETTYGIYFVFGNHDEGYFDSRDFSAQELRDALESNGVVILEDETVLIDDRFYIIGRNDRSYKDRKTIQSLAEGLDKSKYMLVLDHQPNDYDNEAAAGVDLVLSGHTHGGHIFPAGIIGVLIGSNDRAYGTERREETDFIVSSGISGWGIPFKTGTISEYVIIDIE